MGVRGRRRLSLFPMSRPGSKYKQVVIETYYEVKAGKKSRIHARPIEGQEFSTSMDVECSRQMRTKYPIGTRFRLRAKVTDREGGKPFLYSHHGWPWEVVQQ
jgi:hypothetical protein